MFDMFHMFHMDHMFDMFDAWRDPLQEDEYESLAEAVGADHRPPKKKAEKDD